jgi:hypothetical protein
MKGRTFNAASSMCSLACFVSLLLKLNHWHLHIIVQYHVHVMNWFVLHNVLENWKRPVRFGWHAFPPSSGLFSSMIMMVGNVLSVPAARRPAYHQSCILGTHISISRSVASLAALHFSSLKNNNSSIFLKLRCRCIRKPLALLQFHKLYNRHACLEDCPCIYC